MEAVMLVALAAAANKLTTVVKALVNREWNTALTQVVVWVVAGVVVSLAAAADVTSGLSLPGMTSTLGSLDGASLVLLGFVTGSSGSVIFDFTNRQETRLLG